MLHNESKFHEIIDVICESLEISRDDFESDNRNRVLVDARRIAINILTREENYPISHSCRAIGKDHATGIHYRKTHDRLYESDRRYKATYDTCVIKYKKENYSSFKDVLDLTNKFKESEKDVLKLEKENAELRYTILKLENKFREHNFMIPA